jgi:retinol dehydrogenase-12
MAGMSGKTCLVTGATAGIGKETAIALARLGATVVVGARSDASGSAAVDDVRRRVPGAEVSFVAADLSSLEEVRGLAATVRERYDRLDVLVNNAGVIMLRERLTVDGYESTIAVNQLAPFLLTTLLRPLLERSAPARVVTVASAVHKQVRSIPWDDLARGRPSRQNLAYPLSKLLNVLFTTELARRLAGTGVTANCLHPGFVRSELGRDVGSGLAPMLRLVLAVTPSPAQGAKTSVYLASSPEVDGVTGKYFAKSRPARPSTLALDSAAASRVWTVSEELTAA